MGEMILILPLLFVVLSMLIFFGRGVVRLQRAQVMDRYEAWHQVSGAPGPGASGAASNPQMNRLFFGDNAESIEYNASNTFPDDAASALIGAAYDVSADTGDLAQHHFNQSEAGRSVAFTTAHTSRNQFWEQFDGPIRHRHTRIGHNWAHINGWAATDQNEWSRAGPYGPSMMGPTRDVFLKSLDDELAELAGDDNPLANAIRRLYLAQPGYVGPAVEYEDEY